MICWKFTKSGLTFQSPLWNPDIGSIWDLTIEWQRRNHVWNNIFFGHLTPVMKVMGAPSMKPLLDRHFTKFRFLLLRRFPSNSPISSKWSLSLDHFATLLVFLACRTAAVAEVALGKWENDERNPKSPLKDQSLFCGVPKCNAINQPRLCAGFRLSTALA